MLSNFRLPRFDIARQRCCAAFLPAAGALARALPQHCALCAAASGNSLLCGPCATSLPSIGECCPSCALPVPAGNVCGSCLSRPPPFARTIAALAYAFPVDRLVARLKYGHDLPVAAALAAVLAHEVRQRLTDAPLPDAIVPLPLAVPRQRERGFNQACEIARPLARALGRPLSLAIARDRDTPPQASLPRSKRRANVRGAFRAVQPLAGLRVAIVDDVMTTGATLRAAARACLAAGAGGVDAWVVARTLPSGRA
jgi:ComF family protein